MSSTSVERLASCRAKAARATQHFQELEAKVGEFLASDPYKVAVKHDSQAALATYYVDGIRETPTALAAICGDVLTNLRGALDHLAYQLVAVGTGTVPTGKVYFPICEDAPGLTGAKARCVNGINQAASQAIDAAQPYKGGNTLLWQISKLSTIDKHRALVTVGATFVDADVAPLIVEAINRYDWIQIKEYSGGVRASFKEVACPLKEGDELFSWPLKAMPDANPNLRFDIAFSEPGVSEGDPVLDLLRQAIDVVDNLLTTFAPHL